MPKPTPEEQTAALWRLVHLVQDTITNTGIVFRDREGRYADLGALRRLADQLDPEYGYKVR